MFIDYLRGIVTRLFSRIPKTSSPVEDKKKQELAQCRFFIDDVIEFDDGNIGLQGLVQRGRVYVDAPLELVGYGEKLPLACYAIWKGRSYRDYAHKQTHFDPFLLGVKHPDPKVFRKGQVLAAVDTVYNVLRCVAEIEVTGTPANLGKPLARGFEGNLRFREAIVYTAISLPDDREVVMPGETVTLGISLAEQLPLEPGDEIKLSLYGSIFAHGKITEITPII